MRLGFVIDQRKCIGCHACTVACKEENQVSLGVFRTWVKYVEKGEFPHARRHFAVLRCNHCDNAPCVTICPTIALFRRRDGIVDFDREACVGCKACMQACPYDALHLDPETNTAAKCHFCAHRVEVGLEPACVIVCPAQAILTGDLDDPGSVVARHVARDNVQVRKPEQGTRPKLFYLGADEGALTPHLLAPQPAHLWAEPPPGEIDLLRMLGERSGPRTPKPIESLARTAYDIPHERMPWGWKVSAYLWTKSISAGAMLIASLGVGFGWFPARRMAGYAAPSIALVFLFLTTLLLVLDLKRPERFLYLLTRPNRKSWLVKGAWVLMAFGAGCAAWLAGALFGAGDLLRALAWPEAFLAVAAAGYSAFLFGQAEGRDFWQSPLLLLHLLVAAVAAGAATLLLGSVAMGATPGTVRLLTAALAASLTANSLVIGAEVLVPHANQDAARAAKLLTRGHYRGRFWGGVALAGTLAPLALLGVGGNAALTLAALLALGGMLLWEDLWIRAGQSIPLS